LSFLIFVSAYFLLGYVFLTGYGKKYFLLEIQISHASDMQYTV